MSRMPVAPPAPARRIDARLVAGLLLAAGLWVMVIALSDPAIDVSEPFSGAFVTAQDARSYHGFDYADIYAGRTAWNEIGAYPYSPAFAQALWPLNVLPWPLFVAAWTALLIWAAYRLTGPRWFWLGLLLAALEIAGGNISLLLTVAIVEGFRRPWTWSFVLLTKILPGVGLLWFVIRREWRALAIALGATTAIMAVSFLLAPGAWFDWVDLLLANSGKGGTWAAIPVPLVARGPIGLALIAWGALRGQRWTVPVGAMLCLPALWYGSLTMLLGVLPLTTPEERARAWTRIRRPIRRTAP